jgi:hypothetical protein
LTGSKEYGGVIYQTDQKDLADVTKHLMGVSNVVKRHNNKSINVLHWYHEKYREIEGIDHRGKLWKGINIRVFDPH